MRFRGLLKWILYGYVPLLNRSFPYFGEKVFCTPRSGVFAALCHDGVYENDTIHMICQLIEPDSFYFDIGANIGVMAIPVLYRRSDCKVLSIEASPAILPQLLKTVEKSSHSKRWHVRQVAVGSEAGESWFHVHSAADSGLDGLVDTGRSQHKKKVRVAVQTIDQIWADLGRPKVSVIKIDIEGGELQAISGAKECIEACNPHIIIEWFKSNFSAYGHSQSDILRIADLLKYNLYSMPVLIPVKDSQVLALQMLRTDTFLLSPKSFFGNESMIRG